MNKSGDGTELMQCANLLLNDRSYVTQLAALISKFGGPSASAQAELLEHVYRLTNTVADAGTKERIAIETRMQTLLRFGVKAFGPYRTVRLTADSSITLAWIPPGTFMMGNPNPDSAKRADDEHEDYCVCNWPQHQVTLTRGFWMATVPVTQRQFGLVVGRNPSWCANGQLNGPDQDLPVQEVTFEDVDDFLELLNYRQSQARFRLPTEAEWEYACRAGTSTRYWSGDEESDLARVGWYEANSHLPIESCGVTFLQHGVSCIKLDYWARTRLACMICTEMSGSTVLTMSIAMITFMLAHPQLILAVLILNLNHA